MLWSLGFIWKFTGAIGKKQRATVAMAGKNQKKNRIANKTFLSVLENKIFGAKRVVVTFLLLFVVVVVGLYYW